MAANMYRVGGKSNVFHFYSWDWSFARVKKVARWLSRKQDFYLLIGERWVGIYER